MCFHWQLSYHVCEPLCWPAPHRSWLQGKKMTALLKQGTRTPTKGFWESDMVSKKRKELLEKGAHQGWLMNVNELQIGAPIGQGSFGQTFEANWRGTRVRRASVFPSFRDHCFSQHHCLSVSHLQDPTRINIDLHEVPPASLPKA